MSDTVKQRQITRLLELLEPLKVAGKVKKIERVNKPVLQESTYPAIHLFIGAEVATNAEQDAQGWLIEYPIGIVIVASDHKNLLTVVEGLVGDVQAALEIDPQLNGLARWCEYQGDDPFYDEQTKPIGGNTLSYLIQYRRQRGRPDKVY